MKSLLFVFFLAVSVRLAVGAESMKIFSGKSLGDVTIGDTTEKLMGLGFALDDSRTSVENSKVYMKKNNIRVRLVSGKVVQIWFTERELKALSFKGKRLPAKGDPDSFKKFFQGCQEFQGSGGTLL